MPGTVLGGFGAAIDKANDRKDRLFQNSGDIANSLILLFGGGKADWTKWNSLSTLDKTYGTTEIIRSLYTLLKKDFDEDLLKKDTEDVIKIMDEYSKIVKANKKDD